MDADAGGGWSGTDEGAGDAVEREVFGSLTHHLQDGTGEQEC